MGSWPDANRALITFLGIGDTDQILDHLFRFEGRHYELYSLLDKYDTEILLFFMAKTHNDKIKRLISLYFTKLKGTAILLHGKDLIELGFQPGPVFKEMLEKVLEARLNGVVKTREDEIAFVREHFGNAG